MLLFTLFTIFCPWNAVRNTWRLYLFMAQLNICNQQLIGAPESSNPFQRSPVC
jgi:hypothetical protein